MHCARNFGPHAANPISYAEIEAYSRLTGAGLEPWEVDLVNRLDYVFRNGELKPYDEGAEQAAYDAIMAFFQTRQRKGRQA